MFRCTPSQARFLVENCRTSQSGQIQNEFKQQVITRYLLFRSDYFTGVHLPTLQNHNYHGQQISDDTRSFILVLNYSRFEYGIK